MEPFAASGTFGDQRGVEPVVWNFAQYSGPSRKQPCFEIRSTIRGVDVSGFDLEILAPEDPDLAKDIFGLDGYGDLHGYKVEGPNLSRCGGDSGGPWFRSRKAYGVHTHSTTGDCYVHDDWAAFMPIDFVETVLDVTLRTF